MSAPITDGSASSDAAVVALAFGDTLVCTGTVIAPHAVLTAAHCLAGTQLPDVAIGDTLAGATHYPVVASFTEPGFDPVTLDHDLAVVVVASPLPPAPIALAPSLTGVAAGSTIRIVGYGWTVANDTTPPARRTGTSQIDGIDALRIVSHAATSQACEGDSGGPALFDTGDGERIVGVASSGDTTCTQLARHTRVDVHASFVSDVVARTAPGSAAAGDRCYYAANCAIGECLPALDEPALAFCTPPCDAGRCPAGLTCVTVEGAPQCRHPLPSPGADGSRCAADRDCASTLCLAPEGGDDAVCTQRCFSDLPGFPCPDGELCGLAADGREACFALELESGGGGCCAAAHGADPVAAIAVALVVVRQLLRGRGSP